MGMLFCDLTGVHFPIDYVRYLARFLGVEMGELPEMNVKL
jgi:hypothetical protein